MPDDPSTSCTLFFRLPEARAELAYALQGATWKAVAQGLDEYLRRRIKYDTLHPEALAVLEATRENLRAEVAAFPGLTLEDSY
jgi:hypothetical protein